MFYAPVRYYMVIKMQVLLETIGCCAAKTSWRLASRQLGCVWLKAVKRGMIFRAFERLTSLELLQGLEWDVVLLIPIA
jgi:hypothetical protein